MKAKYILRCLALGYLALLLALPVGMIFWRTFAGGLAPVWESATSPAALHALQVTLLSVLISVPLNAAFGVLCAILLVRHNFPGKAALNVVVALPFTVSPVVVGLALVLVYGQNGWAGGWLADRGIQVIFAMPGIILATLFVSLPFVVREVMPVLEEIGTEQEQAAATLGASSRATFWQITLPAIRW